MTFETINEAHSIIKNFIKTDGLFAEYAENIVKSILLKDQSLIKCFESLKTTGERLQFLQKHAGNMDFVGKIPSKDAFIERDLEKALEFKEHGNELFKQNQLMAASDLYTKALQFCPFDLDNLSNNKEYAIILANRSACTDKAGLYQAAVQDIDDALKYGYPRPLHFKVHHRKGHSLLKLRGYADARQAFLKCQDMIGKSDMPTEMRDKWRKKVAKQMSVFNVKKGVSNHEAYLEGSPLTQMTSKQKSVLDENAHAKKDIKFEEIMMCQRPFAIVLQDNKAEGKICPYTLSFMTAPTPCSFGSTSLFANVEARREAENTFHQYEWASLYLLQAADLTPAARLALRIVTSIQPNNVAEVVKVLDNKTQHAQSAITLAEDGNNNTNTDDNNENLKRMAINLLDLGEVNEVLQLPGGERIKLTALVAFFLSCLDKSGFFNDKTASTIKEDTGYLLERALLITGAKNNHAQSVFYTQGSVDKSKLWEMSLIPAKELALAVYSDFAFTRYNQRKKEQPSQTQDGRADVILGYHKGTLYLQSIRDLTAGHSVNLQNVVGAGSSLSGLGKSPLPVQLANMITYKCEGNNCSLSFPLPEKSAENVIVCPLEDCGTETNIWGRRKRIVENRRDHEAARGKIEGISGQGGVKGIDEGVAILKFLIDEWDAMVSRPNKDITCLEEDLTKALLLKHMESEQEWIKGSQY